MISAVQLSNFFVEVADTLIDDFDLVDFLQTLTERAAAVSGAATAGLMLLDHRDRVRFMAASNPSGRVMELLQLQSVEGPCLDCISTGERVTNTDLDEAMRRWPTFAPRAIKAGYRSVHAFPLRVRDRTIGALNLFGADSSRFSPDEIRVVQALADVATISILQERHIARAESLSDQLQSALNTRIIIEQAKGAIAQSEGISVEAAFERLRSQARATSRRIADVAQSALAELEVRTSEKPPSRPVRDNIDPL